MPSRLPILDGSLGSPAENLACDEALLDCCEEHGGGALRFWESDQYFIVLGLGNILAQEVNQAACREQGVAILRRCSGGGSVLQGPGCLNYSLVLEIESGPALQSIRTTNRWILERHCQALIPLLQRPVRLEGHTDLAIGDLKFSGNAQRRRRRCVLFHGTLLIDFDLRRIEQLLRPPRREPAYRQGRRHEHFLLNLEVDRALLKQALGATWNADGIFQHSLAERIATLVKMRYSDDAWNRRS